MTKTEQPEVGFKLDITAAVANGRAYDAVDPFPGGRDLRPYQRDAVRAVREAWLSGQLRPAIVMATGLGKSTIIGRLAADFHAHHGRVLLGQPQRGRRVLFLAHRFELLEQLKAAILAILPGLKVGIVQAERNEVDADIVIGSIQTLAKENRRDQIKDVGLVIVDECHHAVSRTYMETLAHFGVFSDTIAVGVTATMDRLDQKKLADVWESVPYTKGIRDGIADGFLVNPIGKAVVIESLDLSDVKKSKGDYQESQLGEAVQNAAVDIARAIRVHTADRSRRVVFVPTVQAAYDLADELEEEGLNAQVVVGATPHADRKVIYDNLAAGRIDAMVSVMVPTEGWDCPPVDVVVMARPTLSASLYQQCVGRGLRPSPETGKTDCMVLDICEANRIHTLQTLNKLVPDAKYTRAVKDGDELTAAVEEALEAADFQEMAEPRTQLEGVLVDRDLFGESSSLWLRTHKGRRFLPAEDWFVFLWPADDDRQDDVDTEDDTRYAIGIMSMKGAVVGGWRATDGLDYEHDDFEGGRAVIADFELDEAKDLAERLAEKLGGSMSSKGASWRQGNRSPSEAQVKFAKRLAIRNPEAMTKARLSDEITQALASMRLDP